MASRTLTTDQRKEIFLNLVETQDALNSVRKSYEMVTERFEITEAELRRIEEEGLDKEWPPLSEAATSAF
jgi:hypothetical protein